MQKSCHIFFVTNVLPNFINLESMTAEDQAAIKHGKNSNLSHFFKVSQCMKMNRSEATATVKNENDMCPLQRQVCSNELRFGYLLSRIIWTPISNISVPPVAGCRDRRQPWDGWELRPLPHHVQAAARGRSGRTSGDIIQRHNNKYSYQNIFTAVFQFPTYRDVFPSGWTRDSDTERRHEHIMTRIQSWPFDEQVTSHLYVIVTSSLVQRTFVK